MGDLPLSMVRKIRRFEAIETEGLTLYPIAVDEFEAFSHARDAIEFLQQSLPVALLSKPLLQAYYTLELEAAAGQEESVGLLYEAIVFLLLALRAGEGEEMERRLERAQIVPRADDVTRLERLAFRLDGGQTVSVTPVQFQRLRPILAAQNGTETKTPSFYAPAGGGTAGQILVAGGDKKAPTWQDMPEKFHKYTAVNEVITAAGGAFTWTITAATHGIANPAMMAQLYEVATGAQVLADVTVSQTNYDVTVTINDTEKAGTLNANTYRVVLFG